MESRRSLTLGGALQFSLALAVVVQCFACTTKKDDNTSPPVQPAASANAGESLGVGDRETLLRRCCDALRQNASSAAPEQKEGYLNAAKVCERELNERNPFDPWGPGYLMKSLLKGAPMPAACK